MSPSIQLRASLILSAACLAAGCVTAPDIDPTDLPPEALVDNGIDYYSSTPDASQLGSDDLGAKELLSFNSDQWTTDENGNKIYHLNRMPQGQSSQYYVGDIRYMYVGTNNGARGGTGYGNTPVVVSRNGWPLHSDTIRGSNANTYYQTRRGRITYLPNNYRPPAPADTAQDSSTNTDSSGSAPTPTTTPRPSSRRPVTSSPSRQSRRSAPRESRPARTTRRTDDTRRTDR